MRFGGGDDNWAAECQGDCTGTCERCALRRATEDLAAISRWARDTIVLLREFQRAAPFGSGQKAGELADAFPVLHPFR